jgi:hypothetical protein
MEFGPDECIRATVKLTTSHNISLYSQRIIRNMQLDDLGMAEGDVMDKQMEDKLVKEYYSQVCKFSRQLNSKNKITAVSTLAVPALVYSFSIVNWLRK